MNVPAGVATWDHGVHPNLPWTFISIAGADHLRGWVENACVGVIQDPVSGIAYSHQSHLDVPPTPKVRGTRLDPTRCAYEDHNWSSAPNAVRCAGPLEVSHDSRGCAWVCRAHALWRRTLSVVAGHSKDCPRPSEAFRWPSQAETDEARAFVDRGQRRLRPDFWQLDTARVPDLVDGVGHPIVPASTPLTNEELPYLLRLPGLGPYHFGGPMGTFPPLMFQAHGPMSPLHGLSVQLVEGSPLVLALSRRDRAAFEYVADAFDRANEPHLGRYFRALTNVSSKPDLGPRDAPGILAMIRGTFDEASAATGQLADLDASFYDAWTAMARRLGADPLDMARIAHAESGMNPRAFHPGSNAGGLIGFMPQILRGLGWTGTPEEFRQLSATEQVPYVEAYYRPYRGLLRNEGLIYVANFLPARLSRAAASDDSFVLTQSGEGYYRDNRVLDRNGDGTITVGDLRQHLAIQNRGGRYEAIAAELRARGGGGSSPSGPAVAVARRAVPIATVVALAATGALVWYFYATDDGARMRQRAERRIDDLFGAA